MKTLGLGLELSVPGHKRIEIKQQNSTQANQIRAVVKYWLSVDPTPSWRRLVQALECGEEHQAADKVKPYVEPLTGEHCIATVGINVDKVTNDGSMINYILYPTQEGFGV